MDTLLQSDTLFVQTETLERLTTPHLLEVHKSEDRSTFGIGFYDGNPQVPVPIIVDAVNEDGVKLSLKEKTGSLISDSQKEAFVMKLLTSNKTIVEITQEVFGEGLTNFSDEEIEIDKKLDKDFTPNITISIVGPSDVGKSHLVALLSNLGWNTHNLDARATLSNYTERLNAGHVPPFEEPKKDTAKSYGVEATPEDVSAYSTAEFLKIVTSLNESTSQNAVTVIDSGGFSDLDQKARPDSPLLALTRASDVIVLIDNELRKSGAISEDDVKQLVQKNSGLQWIVARDIIAGYDVTGNVEEVAKEFDKFLKQNIDLFKKHALKLRYQFATAFMTPRLMQKVAEFGNNIN